MSLAVAGQAVILPSPGGGGSRDRERSARGGERGGVNLEHLRLRPDHPTPARLSSQATTISPTLPLQGRGTPSSPRRSRLKTGDIVTSRRAGLLPRAGRT